MVKYLVSIFIFYSCITFGQELSNYELKLKEYHKGSITDVILNTATSELFSSGSLGEILVHDSNTYQFKKSLKISINQKIDNIRLLDTNKLAVFYGEETPRLIIYDLHNNRIVDEILNVSLTNTNADKHLVLNRRDDFGKNLLQIYSKKPFTKLWSLNTSHRILRSALSKDGSKIAVIESIVPPKYVNGESKIVFDLKLYDINTNRELFKERYTIDENDYIPSALLFEENTLLVFLTAYEMSQPLFGLPCGIRFKRYNLQDYKSENINSGLFCSLRADTRLITLDGIKVLGFGNKNRKEYLELNYENGLYTIDIRENSIKSDNRLYSESVDSGIYNPLKEEYQFFSGKSIYVLDNDLERLEKNNTPIAYEHVEAFFIDDDWLIVQNEQIVKYFKAGTLSNILDLEAISNNLTANNEKISTPVIQHLDLENGHMGITTRKMSFNSGNNMYSLDYSKLKLYDYDIAGETINHIVEIDTEEGEQFNLDYNAKQQAFLIAEKLNAANVENEIVGRDKYKLAIINKTGVIALSEIFDYLGPLNSDDFKFSNDGNFICLLINGKVKIYDWKNDRSIFEIPELSYSKAIAIEDSDFLISTEKYIVKDDTISDRKGNNYKIVYRQNAFTQVELANHSIRDYDKEGNTTVELVDNIVLINEKKLDLTSFDPKSISLNSDGTRLLVNFNDGKIRMFDVENFNWLNTIINFDETKHLIFNNKGFYYTNLDDLKDLFFIEENSNFLSVQNYGGELYNPLDILKDFGPVEPKYSTALEKATKLRLAKTALAFENNLTIENFYLVDKRNSYQTIKSKNTLEIKMLKPSDSLFEFEIRINNVLQKNLNVEKIDPVSYRVSIDLTQEDNVVDVVAHFKSGVSPTLKKNIKFEGSLLDRNLYVLTIGISNYKDASNNLSFAHKDALDVARFYDQYDLNESQQYLNEIYPAEIAVGDSKISTDILTGLKFLSNENLSPLQVSKDAYQWLELISNPNFSNDVVDQLRLWDFKTGSTKLIKLDDPLDLDLNSVEAKSNKDQTGFYFNSFIYDDLEELKELSYYYDIEKQQLEKIQLPFLLSDSFLITGDKWVTVNSDNKEDDLWDYKYSNSQKPAAIDIYTNKKGKWKKERFAINFEGDVEFSLIEVSANGKSLVLKVKDVEDYSERILIYELKTKSYHLVGMPLEDDDLFMYSNFKNWHIDDIEKTISFVEKGFDDFYIHYEFNYISGEFVKDETSISTNNGNGITGLQNGKPVEVKLNSTGKIPLEGLDILSLEKELVKNSYLPTSFSKTYAKSLTNNNASSESIKQEILTFFKDAQAQDQIILFLAGHGVLDKNLDYYFATHDMNFQNPEINGVSFNTIIDLMNESPAIQKLLLMDTCHAGNTLDLSDYELIEQEVLKDQRGSVGFKTTNSKGDLKLSTVVKTIFDNFTSSTGITVLSASSGENVAYELEGLGNGAFTKSFLELMSNLVGTNFSYFETPDKYYLSDSFISSLQSILNSKINDKQKLDVREINKLVPIKMW